VRADSLRAAPGIARGPAFRLIRGLAASRAPWLALGLAALVAVDVAQLFVPQLIKRAVDQLTLGAATPASLLWLAGGILGLAAAMAALRTVWRPIIMGFARAAERDVRRAVFVHLQGLHLGYLADNPPGELMARATNDLNNIRMAAGMGMVAAIDGVVMGLLTLGFMLYMSPLLTLLAVLPMPAVVIITRVQSKKMHAGFQRVQESFSSLTEMVRECFSGIRVVKAYGLAGPEAARLAAGGRRHLDNHLSLARVLGLFFPLMLLFTNLSLAVVLGAGGPMAVFGTITTGDFVAFYAYLNMLTWPMMALGWVVSLMQRAVASLERVDQVLSARPEVRDVASPRRLEGAGPPALEVRGLDFTYPGAERPTLRGVSLAAPPGSRVALVGRIASGKSTLLGLLARLYEPPEGAVFLDGVDVRLLGQAELRSRLVLVSQEAFLFSATVRHNLALGDPSADPARLWRALEAAELAEDIRELDGGLDAMLGERGLSLSGGQRQRLSLARALVMDPPILALDDPLSAVDTGTERRILANLAELRRERTTIMVSHRLASVSFAERIYVLERGRVAEEGSHRELMAAGGLYRTLFAEQALLAEVEGE
jgi:ATP-binding cassette subfamily B protein